MHFLQTKRFPLMLSSVTFGAGFLFFLAIFGVMAPKVYAVGCNNNSLIYCGYTSPANFIDKVRSNNSGNGHQDLQAIYAAFGLTSGEYSRFTSSAKAAKVYRDGRVIVDGQVVGTNASSWGRSLSVHQGPGMQTKVAGGSTIYGNTTQKTFISQEIFAGHVLFDATGTPEFVVLSDCGNTVTGTFAKSAASCNLLNKAPVPGKLNTYRFSTNAQLSGTAKYAKFVYNFGDGVTITTTSPSTAVEHTYTKPNKYTASVTVYYTTPGGTYTTTSQTCKTMIEVLTPFYDCTALEGALINQTDKFGYVYTATMKYGNGATFVSADFDFGDGAKQTGVKATNATTVQASHRYAEGGDYVVTATLRFDIGSTAVTKTCKVTQPVVNPYGRCDQLAGSILDQTKYSYRFVADMSYGNGATFISADFDFGDGKTASAVKSSDGKTVSVDHTYASPGNYSTSAVLKFSINGSPVTAQTCRAAVTPTQPPTPECRPGVPVGDIRCNPCEYDASIPQNDPRCAAPAATLPNTGAGNVIALASAALVGGFLWYRHLLFRRHKRAYLQADFGTSPLPLAEPLESPDPLAATPLAPEARRRLSLRRRRQF